MNKERIHILEKEPIPKAILKIALPSILSMIVQIVYNLTDTFFVGKLNDPNQVAAVTLAMPIFFFLMSLSGLFGNGGASYISRLLGQKDYETANKTSATAFYSCIILGIIITIIGTIFLPTIVKLSGASENTYGYSYSYLLVIFIGAIIVMLNFALSQLLRSEGCAKEAMIGMLIGTVVNIILDPIFIFVFKQGVTGAAIATIIGNFISVVYYIYFFLRKKTITSINFKYFTPTSKIYAEILKIGLPASLSTILMSLSNIVLNNIAASYNDIVVASYGVCMRVNSIVIMLFIGLAVGIQPLIGFNYGNHNITRIHKTLKISLIIAVSVALFFALLFLIFSKQFITLFINDTDVVKIGSKILFAQLIALPFIGVQIIHANFFQAIGKGMPSLILSVSRQGLIFLPTILILNSLFGLSGFIYAQTAADIITFVLSIILFKTIKYNNITPTTNEINIDPEYDV